MYTNYAKRYGEYTLDEAIRETSECKIENFVDRNEKKKKTEFFVFKTEIGKYWW